MGLKALSELRAARRMAGGPGLIAVMADCERGLGRPERAIELGRSDEAALLSGDEASELRIVVAGARMDSRSVRPGSCHTADQGSGRSAYR